MATQVHAAGVVAAVWLHESPTRDGYIERVQVCFINKLSHPVCGAAAWPGTCAIPEPLSQSVFTLSMGRGVVTTTKPTAPCVVNERQEHERVRKRVGGPRQRAQK